jgi:hypothetical protein
MLLMPVAAMAADNSPQPEAAAKSDLDKVVCRAGEPITGSRLPGPRVCHTQREWNDIRQQSQAAVTRIQMQSKRSSLGL